MPGEQVARTRTPPHPGFTTHNLRALPGVRTHVFRCTFFQWAVTAALAALGLGGQPAMYHASSRPIHLNYHLPLIVLGQIYQRHGEPHQALRYYQEAIALAEEVGEPQLLFPCYEALATLYLQMGDEAQVEQYMLRAQHVCEQAGVDPDSLVRLSFLC